MRYEFLVGKQFTAETQKPLRKTQREEERGREFYSLLSHFFSSLPLFSNALFNISLRFLCGLCVSAVNGLC
jgi:hypothetical protein